MHLPLDLPWADGIPAVAGVILELARIAGGLSPWAYVLHPPATPRALAELAGLLERGGLAPEAVLVENISGRDLELLWPAVRDAGLGVCLDLGHMLMFGQEDFLDLPGLAGHTRMVHLNAPDPRALGRHASLRLLDAAGRALMGRLLGALRPGGSVVLELFTAEELRDSREVLAEYLGQGPGGHTS
jgi:sugar phosphate isomerase/epimerase